GSRGREERGSAPGEIGRGRVLRACSMRRVTTTSGFVGLVYPLVACAAAAAAGPGQVTTLRVPEQGLQPQVAVDGQGGVHLIYFRGDAKNGGIIYARSPDGDDYYTPPP